MTILTTHTADLDKALLAISRWPRRKEREEVLKEAMKFIALQLGYELIDRLDDPKYDCE